MISFRYAGYRSLSTLRFTIDSIRRYISKEQCEVLVVVDDCSYFDNAWGEYAKLLGEWGVVVYRLGPPRIPYWHPDPATPKKYSGGSPPLTSYGHAIGIMAGFYKLKVMGCTHAWVIDGDCWVLNGGWLQDALHLFEYDKVAVVTDYFAGRPPLDCIDLLCDDIDEIYYDSLTKGKLSQRNKGEIEVHWGQWMVGFPNLVCAIVDLGIEERFGALENSGWVNNGWGRQLFNQGYVVGFYPFFQGKHVYHLGHGFTRESTENFGRTYGNLVKTDRYGGKDRGIYHAGYLQLDKTTEEVDKWLGLISKLPLSQPTPLLPPEWLVDPPKVDRHGRGIPYLRPFKMSDLEQLCEFDTNPDCVKYFQWGPHGEDKTRKFLEGAVNKPKQWLALVAEDGLVGYGEIRPEVGDNTCAITYVTHPKHQGKGYAKFLINELYELGYRVYGYFTFIVRIDTENMASIEVLKSMGYEWEEVSEENYLLRGQPKRRKVYRWHHASIGFYNTLSQPDREKLLFEDLGVWQ